MKILRAKKHIKIDDLRGLGLAHGGGFSEDVLQQLDLKVRLVSVPDLHILTTEKWMNKSYTEFSRSIEGVGMMYPILYTDLEHYWLKEKRWPKDTHGNYLPGIGVHTGNKRVRWAKENNYDFIEGYYCKSKAEQATLVKRTFVTKGAFPMNDKYLKDNFNI